MKELDIQIGDRVRLNSGGPLMTVASVFGLRAGLSPLAYYAVCVWLMLDAVEPHIGARQFDVQCLTKERERVVLDADPEDL